MDLNEEHHNIFRQIELRTLQAAAFDRQAENEKALTVLKRAVELAAPGGAVFPFLEIGRPMFDLLSQLRKGDKHAAFVDRILAAFDRPDRDKAPVGIRRPRTGRPPPEQLTIRELEILELLEQRLFDKEIAAKLHISASTVNTHCKNIYQKLGVGNRRRAVASAIELGILDGDQE